VAAVPSIGRATRVERSDAPGAAAASDLYERYSGPIYGYCLHQLGSREEAEDAVQTTFMNAFRGLQRGVVPELESAWLFKIAHNVCLSRRRSSWRRGRVEAPNNFEVLQEVVPGREQVADELIRLQDVLEEMPENQRRAILLREWQGLTYREISNELGLSQAAVETLIFRARRALAQGLEQDADTWKKRLRRGADVGGVIACVKTLIGGGGAAAIKIGTTTALVATAAVAAVATPPAPKHASAHRAHAAKVAGPAAAGLTAAPRPASSSLKPLHVVRAVTSRPHVHVFAARAHATAPPPAPPRPSTGAPAIPADPPEDSTSAAPPAPAPAAQTESAPPPPAPAPASEPAPAPPVPTPPAPPADPEPPPVPPASDPPAEHPSDSHGNRPDRPDRPDKQKPDNPSHDK
jgi:RNA polymerase sigma factor (sigma-70 family)